MAGGGGKPQNIFKLNRGDDPKEVLNWRLWFAVLSFGIMGAARGIDEGLISGTLAKSHFAHKLGLDKMSTTELANVKGNISAMVQIGSVGGAALAFILCDRIGRLWATRQLCLIWILGIVIFLTNGGRLGQVYAGRFIAGLGIGQTTVVAPVYLSEIAPKSVRGLCTCAFSGAVYIGIMLAYFASWGSELHIRKGTSTQWVVPTTIHVMFAGLILILSFFNYESPRYLVKIGQDDKATANLARVRGLSVDDHHVIKEISEIQQQLHEEQEATLGQGAQSITIYAPEFFAMLGTKGQNEKLFATAIFGVVKFVAAIICALFLVDVIGRKRSLGIGIGLQAFSMCYIAAYLTAVPELLEGEIFTPSQKSASTAAIVMIYISGFGWAMGWNSMQYLLNAEIYPLRIRAISSSMVMCFHFVNQYGNSRAVPNMLLSKSAGGLGHAGTFWFFTVITLIGGAWAWFFIPETAGRNLEGMDRLFMLRWWQIGRFGERDADERVVAEEKLEEEKVVEMGTAQQVERV
ncbi:putative quinate permease [Hyaloscypha bicolor E]|uniref:Putative quinate permease n=1 Tax=Hyaloscypha bicolor E TaxID=1095630 RepID=A0A2J6SVW4_9HELO|nr:putative quinate permease [Hyaloscypha bicolor E]PMD54906.1 putative quinate permease [Hyaloscypha bicolor E]